MAIRLNADDPRNRPNYTIAEAAHYLALPQSTVKVWARGRGYVTAREGSKRAKPLFPLASSSPPTMSFWNLVEVYVLASIRRTHGVPLQKVRRALEYVERTLQLPRPLVMEQFYTDGAHLFVKRFSTLISASEQGQTAMADVLRDSLKRIDRDPKGIAMRLYPWITNPTEPRVVEVDPRRAFGRLVVAGTGIPTGNVAERFRGGESIEALARDYRIGREQVEAALRFELRAA